MSKQRNQRFRKSKKWNKKDEGQVPGKLKDSKPSYSDVDTSRNKESAPDGHFPNVITHGKTNNDPSWYTNYPGLPKDYASVPFNVTTGLSYDPFGHNPYQQQGTEMTAKPYGIANNQYASGTVDAGIMKYCVAPVMGDESAVDTAATQLYTMVRNANSGATNYDKTDLMQYVLAMDACYMAYEKFLRVYRVFSSFDYLNRYLPDVLLESMGVAPTLKRHMNDLKGVLDLYAVQLSSFNVPDIFAFMRRHSWIFTNIYCDEDSNGRSQLYFMDSDYFLKWNEGTTEEPTYLQYTDVTQYWNNTLKCFDTVDQIANLLDALIKPLQGSEDVGTMNGDLMKAFGSGKMIKIMQPKEFEPIRPAHDTEVLEQLANAEIVGCQFRASSSSVKPNLNDLVHGPKLTQNVLFDPILPFEQSQNGEFLTPWYAPQSVYVRAGRKSLLNMYDDISPERCLTATRFKHTIEEVKRDDEHWDIRIASSGTEIICSAQVWFKNEAGSVKHLNLNTDTMNGLLWSNSAISLLTNVSRFRYAPVTYIWTISKETMLFNGYMNDNTIIAWLSDSEIRNLNRVCVMSEYAVDVYPNTLA